MVGTKDRISTPFGASWLTPIVLDDPAPSSTIPRYRRLPDEACTVRAHDCFPYPAGRIANARSYVENYTWQIARIVGGGDNAHLILAALRHLEAVRRLDDE